ncbi:MAG: hypothetical protein BalsKO_03500 [Balneolaceae bacterium]
MKPSHFLKEHTLVVKIPETYDFEEVWTYLKEELPACKEYEEANYCIVDGSEFKYLSSLGMSTEIILFGHKFLALGGIDFILCGFKKMLLITLSYL